MKKPENIDDNKNACICPNCPLFTDCNTGKNEKFFCGEKKSECPMDSKKMCICGGCAVFDKYDLTGGYFCINEIIE
jgi:hypothetical protein